MTWNSTTHIGACVDSIVAGGGLPIVVDNGSTDDTLEIVRARSREARIVAAGENSGYGKAMNLGFQETKGQCVILSNPDVVFLEDSIRQMAEFIANNPRIGITGPQQMFPNRSWQRSYGDLPGIWSGVKDALGITALHNGVRRVFWPRRIDRKPKEVPYLDGAVLAVRREAFLGTNGFDKQFFLSSDECDLCVRLRKAGWDVVFFPEAQVIHVRGGDTTKRDTSDRFVRYHVASQSLLASRYLPPWKARAYARLQVVHYGGLEWAYRFYRRFSRADGKVSYKIQLLEHYSRIWRERANGRRLREGAQYEERL